MTKIVGILNVTPDSFSDGGQWNQPEAAVQRVKQLFDEGADIIDIGAESTRPGATAVTAEYEWQRLEPIIQQLRKICAPDHFSFDTRHGETAKRIASVWSPDVIINDVTGLSEPQMVEAVALYGLRVVVGHLPAAARGDIARAHQQKMTNEHEIKQELMERVETLMQMGINKQNIILDPGIGFGKTPELNHKLVAFAALVPDFPVMIGYSRKRFIGEYRLDPQVNAALGKKAVAAGTAYLRVHDVAIHKDLVQQ